MKQIVISFLLFTLVFGFSQSFGQTYELSPKDFKGDVYVIGMFKLNKKDSLFYYSDMRSRKFSSYDFSEYLPLCEGECHFFAYDHKWGKYYFYSDNLLGYIQPPFFSDFEKKMKKNVKMAKVPKVNDVTVDETIFEIKEKMSNEYYEKNKSIQEAKKIAREKFVKDSIEQAKIRAQELIQERDAYRKTHNWHLYSMHQYLECLLCNKYRYLDKCYIVAIDSNYCHYLSPDPTLKLLGVEYKELHRSRISYIINVPEVKEFFEIWKDTIANPKSNPIPTKKMVDEANLLNYMEFCDKVQKIAPYGFIKSYGWNLNSVNGVEPRFEFFNTNDKTIKYVDFYFSIYNAVNDICYLDYTSTIGKVRGVGPVESFDSGSWEWDRATHYTSAAADHMRIVKLVLTYMDGSTKTLTGDMIIIDSDDD